MAGVDQGILIINSNGTYGMGHDSWKDGQIHQGQWRIADLEEFEGKPGIVLPGGLMETDWAVILSAHGRVLLLRRLELPDGKAAWAFEAELERP